MAGDWIKMRGNLWDDPRITRLCDLTEAGEAAIVGGLYWLWATADQHTEDGIMPGLSIRQIDRKTGIPGFGDALISIGWIADHPEGIRICNFEDHNGASAKKRCQTAKRVATFKSGNAEVTQQALPEHQVSVTGALPREEKIREDKIKDKPPTVVKRASKKCPADFEVTDDMRTWAALECPTVHIDWATAKMRDHTFKNAITDWVGAWRNWLRRDAETAAPAVGRQSEPGWRRDARERMQAAVPSIAEKSSATVHDFFEAEVKNVTPIALD